MCGIAGVYQFKDREDLRDIVRSMTSVLERRGPDDEGVESNGAVTFGNRRLAILDLSDAGHQPMRSADGRYLITFNGEIYNYESLRRELGVADGSLRSGTDTEVVLCAWQRWGAEALERMVGQWAFAIYDRTDDCMWLARDRFGEKPLFYHRDAERLTFASSIPAVLRAPWIPAELDDDALAEYVTLRYVVSPRTVLRDIRKLPGGHLLRVDADGADVTRWYAPKFKSNAPGRRNRDDLVEEFDALFGQAAERCLVSDVPVALLLSDGIDSHSIRAVLSGRGRDITSFTYKLTQSESGLAPASEAPAGGQAVTNLHVTPGDRMEKMAQAFGSFTEPVGDGAALATWLLIRNARDRATVFLCGHGGDEVLGGYRLSQDRFRLSVVRRLAHLPEPWVRKLLDRFLYGAEPVSVRRRTLLDSPPNGTPAAARYLIHRPLPPSDVMGMTGRDPRHDNGYLAVVDRLYRDCSASAGDVDCMQEVMLHTFLSENILSFADAMAMDSSAELRMPFLDRDLVEFVLSLPRPMRVSRWPGRANTKLILRWWGRKHLPPEIISRRKRAFPFGNLPELLESNGDEIRDRIVGSSAVRRTFPGLDGWLAQPPAFYRGSWEGTLWALLSLGIWCERHDVR